MRMPSIYYFALVFILCLSACKTPPDPTAPVETPTSSAPLYVPDGFSDAGISIETIQSLTKDGDHIDYIFNELPLSMNQTSPAAITTDMGYISSTPIAGIPTDCSPMARKIYLGNGEILLESDLYFSQQCLFQVFILNDKPLYGNLLTMEAVNFYGSLMEQAKESMPEPLKSQYVNPLDN